MSPRLREVHIARLFSLKFERRAERREFSCERRERRGMTYAGIIRRPRTQGIFAKYSSSESGAWSGESGSARSARSARSAANCAASPNEVHSLSPNEVNLSEFCSSELAPPVLTGSGSGGNSPCNDSKTWMVKGEQKGGVAWRTVGWGSSSTGESAYCLAAQRRQARPGEAQEPSWGAAQGAR